MKNILFLMILFSSSIAAQIPVGYYDGTEGLKGYALKSRLHAIISARNINWHYGDLPNYYNQTDLDIYYDYDASNTTILLDMYSEIPTGPDAYEYTSTDLIGSASAEGKGWNREHMIPQSTFYSNYPMYSDLFFVIPADARINQLRSNFPYGISGTQSNQIFHTFTNSSKIGRSAIPNHTYTGRVYEPINEFKGDIARILLYFVVRYEGKLGSFRFNTNVNPALDTNPLDGTEEKAFDDAYLAMLLQWHTQDPVSQREIDRNNAIYTIQNNRNPFVDYPEWVNMIWRQTPDTIPPSPPSNLSVTQAGAYFATLSWSPSLNTDAIGYQIYQDGKQVGSTRDTFISIDHLNPSTTYHFTVKAYNNGYLFSSDSNTAVVTTLASDGYAKDLFISKYLEGTSHNKAIEITNKTGHPVNLNAYRLSIQLTNGSRYYFPAPYQLEGMLPNNEVLVVLNPNATFSCINNNEANLVTAAPQMTYSGSQYIELRYRSTTIDAIGTRSQSNSSLLSNVSLYRKNIVNQPTQSFNIDEWVSYPRDYCKGIGTLSTLKRQFVEDKDEFKIYPNPVQQEIFIKGTVKNIKTAKILDFSGRIITVEKDPFERKTSINVHNLKSGMYLLQLDDKTYFFIKK